MDLDRPAVPAGVCERDPVPDPTKRRQLVLPDVRPFRERHRIGTGIVGKQIGIFGRERLQAVEVEVRDPSGGCGVKPPDRERRTRHGPFDSERAGSSADKRRLARAELTADEDNVAGLERRSEVGAKPLGLGGARGLEPHRARHCRSMRDQLVDAFRALRASETSKAAGLAGAMIVNNVIALVISVVFARLLPDYGALAALISYLLILTVVGQAMQIATAREGVLGALGSGDDLLHTLERWSRALLLCTAVATVVSILLRVPIAELVGVRDNTGGTWAAALGIPAGCAYLWVSILRGALQGVGDYRSVGLSLIGEQSTRLLTGGVLAAAGLGVAGAFAGSLIAYTTMGVYCATRLYRGFSSTGHRRWGAGDSGRVTVGLTRHIWAGAIPIAGLAIVQLLQNVDLIVAKHRLDGPSDNSYAVAAVAAKVMVWVAMGAGFYLVPETSKRHADGRDTRPVLMQSLAIVGICAIPCLLIFAFAAHPLLSIVFGAKRAVASDSLLPLGAAFTVLAATYLAVQYMLALRHTWFLLAIGIVAIVEPVLLLRASRDPGSFATTVLLVQIAGAALAYAIAFRAGAPPAERAQNRSSCSDA